MKRLLLFFALVASINMFAQVQPTVVNPDFDKMLDIDNELRQYAGWYNSDLSSAPGESSWNGGTEFGVKYEGGDNDLVYQEVEVLANTDYEFTYTFNMDGGDYTALDASSVQALVLSEVGYEAGYTPAYGTSAEILDQNLGYRAYADLDVPANIIAELTTADTDGNAYSTLTISFNSGTNTSIALVIRGIGGTNANGNATIRVASCSLTNVTPAIPGVQLTDLLVDGVTITGFDKAILPYVVELPKGTTVVPTVTVTADPAAVSAVVTEATELPGTTTILVTAADASTQTYSVKFNAKPFDQDATLSDLLVDGTTIANFDPEVYYYSVELGVGVRTTPTVTATANSAFALAPVITPAPSVPGTTTILVTAEDGSTATYTVAFSNFDPTAPIQPVVQNYDFVKLPKSSGSDASCSGWQNKDLGDDGETNTLSSTNGLYAMKFDNAEPDVMYQEVAVQSGKDYELIYTYRNNVGTSLLDLRILKGSGYETGYTPAYEDNELAPSSGYGYTDIANVVDAANNLASVLQASPGDDDWHTDTLRFNSGTETSIAIFGRGIVSGSEPAGAAGWVNGDQEVKIDSVNLKNTTVPVIADGMTLTDLLVDGTTVTDFDPQDLFYDVVLGRGVTTVPTVTATKHADAASAVVTDAAAIPGIARVLVTATSDGSKAEYAISFTNYVDGLATLSEIQINSEVFGDLEADVFYYEVELPYGTTVVPTVTATTTSAYAVKVVNDAGSLPGTTEIVVTADDGSQETYELEFTVALNDDATLSDLQVNGSTLADFDADTYTYNFVLPWGTTDLPIVTATETVPAGAEAVVTNATEVDGTATVVVTAEDGTEQTYSINFSVALNDDATLSDLLVDGETVDGFDAADLSYDVVLANGTTVVPTVTATANADDAETPEVTAAAGLPGTTTVLVTAEDGTELTYSVNFSVALNNDTTLSALNVDGTILSDFASTKQIYTYGLAAGTTDVPTVTATETVVTSNAVVTPAASLPGTTNILVTAEDGSTATYTIQFFIGEDPDATLSDLLIDGTTVEGFSASTFSYDVVLDNGTTAVPVVTATANSATAELPVVTATTSLPGATTILVTAEDGTELTYTVNFTVAKDADASLSDLLVDGATVEGFATDKLSYDVELDNGTTVVPTVTATESKSTSDAVVTAAASLPGATTVLVTAEDGTELTYTVNFTLASNADATLSDLLVDGTTVEGFATDKLSYDVELDNGTTVVPTVTATETKSTSNAVVTAATSLPGATTVLVTAEDGTEQTYTVNFTVAKNADATLSDLKVDGSTVASFAAATLSYNVELANGTTVVPTVTATATESTSAATVTAVTALPGTTTVLVKAEDGTEQTYSIAFTVAKNSDASLSDLQVDGSTVASFAAATLTYNVELANGTTVVPTVTAASTASTSTATVTAATVLPGTTTVLVKAEDGTEQTYSIAFTVAKNSDASLSTLTVDGSEVAGFETATLVYYVELPYGTETVPTVDAASTNAAASFVVTPAESLPGTTTVVVTAEDGTISTYSVEFSVNTTSIDSELSKENITVFANNAILNVDGVEAYANGSVIVYNTLGKVISTKNINSNNVQVELDAKGVFIVMILDDNNNHVTTKKVLIK